MMGNAPSTRRLDRHDNAAPGSWLMGGGRLPNVVNGYKWELYNIAEDYSQSKDLAAAMPDKLRSMVSSSWSRRRSKRVSAGQQCSRASARGRAPPRAGLSLPIPVKCPARHRPMPPNTLGRSFSISAEVDIRKAGPRGCSTPTVPPRRPGLPGQGQAGLHLCPAHDRRFRWESPTAPRPASAPSCSTSGTTVPVSARAAPASCRWMAGGRPQDDALYHSVSHQFRRVFRCRRGYPHGVDDNDYQVPFVSPASSTS